MFSTIAFAIPAASASGVFQVTTWMLASASLTGTIAPTPESAISLFAATTIGSGTAGTR